VVELIEQAKARGAAIVGIFHDETVRSRVADRLHPMGTRMIINNVKLVLENEVVDGSIEDPGRRYPRVCRNPEPLA
jgi:hypothetical protein